MTVITFSVAPDKNFHGKQREQYLALLVPGGRGVGVGRQVLDQN